MVKSIFFIASFFFYFPQATFALQVNFHESALVTTPFVTLADIAGFDEETPLSEALGSQRIGYAPAAGESISLDSKKIIQELSQELTHRHDIQWAGSPSILLSRKGITIIPEKIEKDIAEYLTSQQDSLPLADYLFVPQQLPLPFTIPTGKLDLEIIPASPRIIGSKRFTLIYKVDGEVVKNISIKGRLQVLAPVVVLTRNVKRDEIILEDMITMETKDLSSFRTPCLDLREVVGKKLTKRGRAGQVLDISSVDFPAIIQKGQLVKILVNHKGLALTATGIASMNGKQDQIIRVKNTGSQKTIFCRVAAPGIVEVTI